MKEVLQKSLRNLIKNASRKRVGNVYLSTFHSVFFQVVYNESMQRSHSDRTKKHSPNDLAPD